MLLVGLLILGKRSFKSPYAKRLFGAARVLAFGCAVSAVAGAVTARNAVADVETRALNVGRDLEGMQDLLGQTTVLHLNGQTVYYAHATTADPVEKVADRFEAYCNEDPALNGKDWDDLADLSVAPSKKSDGIHLGTIRKNDDKKGDTIVVCFRRPEGEVAKTWAEALEEFSDTGDLKALGNMRYAHISRSKNGKTGVQSVWTNGSFNLNQLMPPEDGADTIGSDPTSLPRPAQSQRVLTATADGTPYAVRIYVTSRPMEAAVADYVDEMDRGGWLAMKHPLEPDNPNELGRWFEREGAQAMISATVNDEGKTVLVVGDLGSNGALPARGVAE
jgi:hypothetical protein